MLTRTASPHPARAGFTLIELLISIAAMGLVLFYALGTFTVNHNTYVVVDQVSESHQNAMAISTLLERDIRNAGYMVPDEAAACGVDSLTGPDVLFVSDRDAIRVADELPVGLASDDLGAEVQSTTGSNPITITVDDVVIDEQPTYDTDTTPGADSDFRVGGGVIMVDVANPGGSLACGIVQDVDPAADTVDVQSFADPAGSGANPQDLQLIPAHVYRIVGTELFRDGVSLAKDVEDLQVAWFHDADDDGQATGTEYSGVSGNPFDHQAVDGNDLRELRVNLVVRTRDDDPRNPTNAGTGQATENQTNAPGPDGKRRRVHTATVRLRNLGQ